MHPSRKLQTLEVPIKETIWLMHQARLGYEPSAVSCIFLKSFNLVISLERSRSATEQFLLKQEKLQLAQEVGTAINHILKNEIAKLLKDDFDLSITEISFLTPTAIESFSLWALLEDSNPTAIASLTKLGATKLGATKLGATKPGLHHQASLAAGCVTTTSHHRLNPNGLVCAC